jgi:hypothetical protein
VSPAFIRELLRKAALLAVGTDGEIVVEDHHLDQALLELVVQGGDVTGGCSGRPDSGPGARPEAGDDPRKLTKPPGHR